MGARGTQRRQGKQTGERPDFTVVRWGYDRQAVDGYIAEVERTLRATYFELDVAQQGARQGERERDTLRAQLEGAMRARQLGSGITEVVDRANEWAATLRAEADQRVAEAREEAEQTLAEARARAAEQVARARRDLTLAWREAEDIRAQAFEEASRLRRDTEKALLRREARQRATEQQVWTAAESTAVRMLTVASTVLTMTRRRAGWPAYPPAAHRDDPHGPPNRSGWFRRWRSRLRRPAHPRPQPPGPTLGPAL